LKRSRFLVLVGLVVVILLGVTVWFYPSSANFRPDNPFWNGLSTFGTELEVKVIDSFDSLPQKHRNTALIVIPYLPLSEDEIAKLENYTSSGGTLLILDDYGYGNDILEDFESVGVRFSGQPLLDPLFNYKNQWFPKILDFEPPLSDDPELERLVLNYATVLDLGSAPEATVLAWSSKFSYLDENYPDEKKGEERWDEGEPQGPLPIAARFSYGRGTLVLVTDPSLLINGMQEIDNDNYRFIRALTQIGGAAEPEVFLDRAHLPEQALDEAKGWLSGVYDVITTPVAILGITVAILAITLSPIWRRRRKPTIKSE
jgi:hypothetical protein